jgi:DNA-binding NtrC family response regulator
MSKKLLVVDDEPNVRNVVSRLLQRSGWEVRTACDGIEARDAIVAERPDLVLLDLNMPHRDGIEVLGDILEIDAGIPVIMVTGEGDSERARLAMKRGARDYVSKPMDLTYLTNSIKAILAIG